MKMRLNKLTLACMMAGSTLLVACGGGGDSVAVAPVSSLDTTAAISPATGAAVVESVVGESFAFAAGVPLFGTATATTLALSGTGAAPGFSISSGGLTATGVMSYGSCIFKVAAGSTFLPPSPLAAGEVVTVTPCALTVDTSGVVADGKPTTSSVVLVLGAGVSAPVAVTLTVSPTGVVTVNDSAVGTTTLVAATGAGS